MDEQFNFTPTVKENEQALRAVARSMASVLQRPARHALYCLTIYGLPLAFAAFFFRDSFDKIYLTFFLFVVGLFVFSRFAPNAFLGMASRFAVPQEVRLNITGIRQVTDCADTTWPWTSLNRVHVLKSVIVIEFRDWSWVPLPNRMWTDDEVRQRILDAVRAQAPGLLPDLPSTTVASPFTLISVGAAFGAIGVFLLQLVGVIYAAASPDWHLPAALNPRMTPSAFGILFAAVVALAILSFFPIRRGLRALDRRHPRLASVIAAMLIAAFGAVLLACFHYRPCGC